VTRKTLPLRTPYGRFVLGLRICLLLLLTVVPAVALFFFSRWEDALVFPLLAGMLSLLDPRVELTTPEGEEAKRLYEQYQRRT
jgi:hypothetical protein